MKKANLSSIMKRAWMIKKLDSRNIFGLCLKMAWAEYKALNSEEISFSFVKGEVFTVNQVTGVISGKTYSVKEDLKKNFGAKWDSKNKVWTAQPEAIRNELAKSSWYYVTKIAKTESKKVVSATVNNSKVIKFEKLVNCEDGFYNKVTYTDGTSKMFFVG